MSMSKEEALRELHTLREQVETTINRLKEENRMLQEQIEALKRELKNNIDAANRLREELQAYAGLKQVFVALFPMDEVDKRIKSALESYPTAAPEGTVLKMEVPNITLQISKPDLTLDEGSLEGRILVLAYTGKLGHKFTFAVVRKALQIEYGNIPRHTTLQRALDDLVGKYKALDRIEEGKQIVYALRPDLDDRMNETLTKKVVNIAGE
jgi:hypothetical protein